MAGTEELTLLSSGAFAMGIEFTLAMPLNTENTYLKKKGRKKLLHFWVCFLAGKARWEHSHLKAFLFFQLSPI